MKDPKQIIMRYTMKLVEEFENAIDKMYKIGEGTGEIVVEAGYEPIALQMAKQRGFNLTPLRSSTQNSTYLISPDFTVKE